MKYFVNVNTIDELKKEYRTLAKKNHPDRGGDCEVMKEINAEYEKLFEILNAKEGGKHNISDGFREVIDQIINLDGIEIEICGLWIWVGGDTKPVKDALSKAGFYFARKKVKWYWHPPEASCRFSRGIKDMDYIRRAYGSEKIKEATREDLKKIS